MRQRNAYGLYIYKGMEDYNRKGWNILMQLPGYFCDRKTWQKIDELYGGYMSLLDFIIPPNMREEVDNELRKKAKEI
jgi:hypothetical protein